LLDHPKIMPIIRFRLGDCFRLDRIYGMSMTTGMPRGRLHADYGATAPTSGARAGEYYPFRDNQIYNGFIVVTWILSDAGPGIGGFCCIPGSHKSNFVANLPDDVRRYKRVPHYVVQPAVEPGDALIFTEALMHGTMPWTADHERRALLFKYSPGNSAWMKGYYNLEDYPQVSEQQQRLMAAPSVGERPNTV
jgi:ectoine hydroxylase-related dioxygenase (phytanoyl-CoA dioxygenase family)